MPGPAFARLSSIALVANIPDTDADPPHAPVRERRTMSNMPRPAWGLALVLALTSSVWLTTSPSSSADQAQGPMSSQSLTLSASTIPVPPPLHSPVPSSSTSPIAVAPPTGKADDGSYVRSETWLDPRMADLDVYSVAVGSVVRVRIIVPNGWWADAGGTGWPVLFLLHGGKDDYTAWTRETDIESFVSTRNLIVVMPDNSPIALATRWWNNGKNKPDYETFDAVELMQLMERGYGAKPKRAVAGVSAGGYGAMILAAHYPRTFAAAASYSGIVDTTTPGASLLMRVGDLWQGYPPNQVWGDPNSSIGRQLQNENNPYSQALNLRGTRLFLSCGDGTGETARDLPGKLGLWAEGMVLRPQTVAFINRLEMHGIPAQADLYKGGIHNWISWKVAFAASWPVLAAGLGLPS